MPTTQVNGRTAMSGISAVDHQAVTADGVTLALARYIGTAKQNIPVLMTQGLFEPAGLLPAGAWKATPWLLAVPRFAAPGTEAA
jgi:hypothetical protein